jgi:tetratricopeptide (TPR) repeat protein
MRQMNILFLRCFPVLFVLFLSCSDSRDTRLQRFLILGNEAVQQQNFEQAASYYEGALSLDSCFADALNNLGTLNYNQKNYGKAVDYYNRTLSCKPDFEEAYLNRSRRKTRTLP